MVLIIKDMTIQASASNPHNCKETGWGNEQLVTAGLSFFTHSFNPHSNNGISGWMYWYSTVLWSSDGYVVSSITVVNPNQYHCLTTAS